MVRLHLTGTKRKNITNSVTFKISDIELLDDGYRTDIPTPAEYQPLWDSKRKCFYTPNPLYYNELVDDVSHQMVDVIDEEIIKELLQQASESSIIAT
jgi:hypothetical protein